MAIHVALNHKTDYHYDRPVTLPPQVIRLRPAPHCRTPILSYSLKVAARPSISSTGSRIRTATTWPALVFPEAGREFVGRSRSDRRDDHRSIRSTSSSKRAPRSIPFTYDPLLAKELTPYLETKPAGPLLQALVDEMRATTRFATIDYWSRSISVCSSTIRYIIRMEPGIQSLRGNADETQRLVPRFGLAAGATAAASRSGGALRLRLSDPADGRRASRSMDLGARARFHRPARLGRSLSAGRRLGRPRSDIGPAGRRRAHSAGLHRRPDQCRPDHRLVQLRGRRLQTTDARTNSSSR